MDDSQVMGMVALIVSVGGAIIAIINHKRLRSSCCGKKLEVSVDIENTTPPQSKRRDSVILDTVTQIIQPTKINIPPV